MPSVFIKLLEGRLKAEVKSIWSLYVGLHTCYKGEDKEQQKREL